MASSSGFGYDAVSNRTTRSIADPLLTATETYGYDTLSNRLLSSVSTSGESRTVTHGDSGNRDADTVTGGLVNKAFTMAYDATDRLVEVSNAGVPLGSYLHNALGQRVSKTVGVATTHYLYDLSGRLIAEADGATGAAASEYIAFEGINLAYITTGSIYWVHGDHLGTPQVLTDAAGAEAWSAAYDPFGAATVTSAIALTYNPRFPGQYKDEETALHYNYFRTYDPTSGRYVESDPIGLRGGWNTYGYVGGNPVMRMDVFGLANLEYVPIKHREKIQEAIDESIRYINGCIKLNNCPIDVSLGFSIIKKIETSIYTFNAKADYCGASPPQPGPDIIELTELGFNEAQCCPQSTTITHEGYHLADPEASEVEIESFVKYCFGCSRLI